MTATVEPEIQFNILNNIKRELPNDEQISLYLQYLQDSTIPRPENTQEYLINFTMKDELILKHSFIYVPTQDPIKTQILQAHYDTPLISHLG